MIIDDDDALRLVLRQQFESEGIVDIAEAASVGEIWQTLDSFGPDMLLLDVQMPDGNGFDVCQRLRDRGFENLSSCSPDKIQRQISFKA